MRLVIYLTIDVLLFETTLILLGGFGEKKKKYFWKSFVYVSEVLIVRGSKYSTLKYTEVMQI